MDKTQYHVGIILGILLIGAGLVFLLGQILQINLSGLLWPWIIVLIGGAFFAGMVLGGKQAGPLAVPGSIIAMIGLILFVQNTFDLWLSWAYSWGLIVCSVGIGLVIYGHWSDLPDLRTRGWEVARVGLILFLVFTYQDDFITGDHSDSFGTHTTGIIRSEHRPITGLGGNIQNKHFPLGG